MNSLRWGPCAPCTGGGAKHPSIDSRHCQENHACKHDTSAASIKTLRTALRPVPGSPTECTNESAMKQSEPMNTRRTVTVTRQHAATQRNQMAHTTITLSLAHTQNETIESATEQTSRSNTTHSSANSTLLIVMFGQSMKNVSATLYKKCGAWRGAQWQSESTSLYSVSSKLRPSTCGAGHIPCFL